MRRRTQAAPPRSLSPVSCALRLQRAEGFGIFAAGSVGRGALCSIRRAVAGTLTESDGARSLEARRSSGYATLDEGRLVTDRNILVAFEHATAELSLGITRGKHKPRLLP